MKLIARKLLSVEASQLKNFINGRFTLVFDDNSELEVSDKETIISSYFWNFHRVYKEMALLPSHHLTYHLKGKRLKASSHQALIKHICKTWHETYGDTYTNDDLINMLRLVYESYNQYYNEISTEASEFMTTLDLIDLINVVKSESVRNIRENGDYSQTGIPKIHKEIINEIENNPEYKNNPVSKMLRGGLLKSGQLVQCIGPFGYSRDVDDHVFRSPIKRGYIEGLRSFYDSLTESRSAAIALYSSSISIKQTEYFSRKAQLVSMNLHTVHRGDCGSTNFLPWEINSEKDLRLIEGVYYYDEDSDSLKIAGRDDKHLIGGLVKLRTVVGCMHKDPNGVCSTCFGRLSKNILEKTNIGQQVCSTMAALISQTILSIKHLNSSASVAPLVLKNNQNKFFVVSKDGSGYILSPKLRRDGLKVVFDEQSMLNITSVERTKDVTKLSPPRITEFKDVRFNYLTGSGEKEVYREELVKVMFQGRKAYASLKFLEYIKKVGWSIDEKDNYVIDLSGWTGDEVIFKCPAKQYSMVSFSNGVSEIIEARRSDAAERDNMSPLEFIKSFVEFVSQRIDLSFSVLSAIAYSSMVVSMEKGDYSMPKPWTEKGVGVLKDTIFNRSLSAALAFEQQAELLTSPQTFLHTNRQDHVFDWMFLPQEVIKYRND